MTSSTPAVIRFRVRSTSKKTMAAELVEGYLKQIPELNRQLRENWPKQKLSVEADREQSVPIDPATAYLVLKFVGIAISGTIIEKIVEDCYEYLKDRVKNGSLTREEAAKKNGQKTEAGGAKAKRKSPR